MKPRELRPIRVDRWLRISANEIKHTGCVEAEEWREEKKIPPVENKVAVYFIIKSDKLRVLLAEHGFYASGHPSLKQSEDGSNHVLKCFHVPVIKKNIFYFSHDDRNTRRTTMAKLAPGFQSAAQVKRINAI